MAWFDRFRRNINSIPNEKEVLRSSIEEMNKKYEEALQEYSGLLELYIRNEARIEELRALIEMDSQVKQ